MKYLRNKSLLFSFITLILFISLAGCKSDNALGPVNDNNISVGYFTGGSANDNTLIIDEVKFIVRKIVLEREEEHGGEECDVKQGPFVVNLDMNTRVILAAVAVVPAGNYNEIHFQIHKLNPNESVNDPEFFESTSRRFSVIIKGYFNGVRFVYKSPITFEKEIEFENHTVSVTTASVVNITVRLDVYSWFTNNGINLDPSDPANSSIIDHNIKNSFRRAFRDLNMDGEPD